MNTEIAKFVSNHPWMTFFIILSALQVVGNLLQFMTAYVLNRGR